MAEKTEKAPATGGGQDLTAGAADGPMAALIAQLAQAISANGRSDADDARQRERNAILARQATEDRLRGEGGEVEVVALTGFTIVEDGAADPRVVRAGEVLVIPAYDLPAWSGRVRLRALDAEPETGRGGVKISG